MKSLILSIQSYFKPSSMEELSFKDQFISLSINKNITDSITFDRLIQLEDQEMKTTQYALSRLQGQHIIKKFCNSHIPLFHIKNNPESTKLYFDQIANIFHITIENGKNLLERPSEIPSDIQSETRGLEWIKATLVVLKSAIQKSLTDDSLIFQGQLFSGKRNRDEHFQIRIQCLSLDFLLLFFEDGRLNISVWNYKNQTPDSKTAPVFTGEFAQLKRPVFDEIIVLLVEMSKAATKLK